MRTPERLLRQLIKEQALQELIQSKNPKTLATTVANFLRTKYGSALASMAPAVFAATIQTAAGDIMTSKGMGDDVNTRSQIVQMVQADLTRTGDTPRRKKKTVPTQEPKKKTSLFGRMFGN